MADKVKVLADLSTLTKMCRSKSDGATLVIEETPAPSAEPTLVIEDKPAEAAAPVQETPAEAPVQTLGNPGQPPM